MNPPALPTTSLLRHPGPPRVLEGAGPVAIYDPRLADVLDPQTPLLCFYDQASHSEGPVWDAAGRRLIWSDVVGRRVLALREDGQVDALLGATDFINGNAMQADGTLLHCEHGRRCISRSPPDGGEAVPLITHYDGKRFNAPNDITVARDGAIWFTDPIFGITIARQGWLFPRELDHQSLYRYEPGSGALERMADFEQPNGLAFTPDGETLYVSDTSNGYTGDKHEIIAFDVGEAGALTNRRLFKRIEPGVPDGFKVDDRGWVWSTSRSGIQVFDAKGTPLGLVPTPTVCANCAFGGVDGRRLFIAAEACLLGIDLRG